MRPTIEQVIAVFEKHEKAAEMDAGHDHGEFSGVYHQEMMERELNDLGDWDAVLNEDAERAFDAVGYWDGESA